MLALRRQFSALVAFTETRRKKKKERNCLERDKFEGWKYPFKIHAKFSQTNIILPRVKYNIYETEMIIHRSLDDYN